MLKTIKNQFFQSIESHELSPDFFDFEGEESGHTYKISLVDSPLSFWIDPFPRRSGTYVCFWNMWAPGFPTRSDSFDWDLSYVEALFDNWIIDSVIPYLKDKEVPDLWEQYTERIEEIPTFKSSEQDYEDFSNEEKLQIKESIETFRVLLIENYQPKDEQLEVVNERLDYLSQAVDRLNRFDWKSVALSTIIGIATNLAVDTETARQIFDFFQEAFSQHIQFLPMILK